jgi:glucose-6-phosphate 1-dehydrogenase
MAKLLPVDEFDLIIFGATGDLAMRKLIPALYHRDRDGQFTAKSRIIAASRGDLSRAAYLDLIQKSFQENLAPDKYDQEHWDSFCKRIDYVQIDALNPDQWARLVELLSAHPQRIRVAYLATAPTLFGPIAQGLSQNRLITADSRIVLEKPVGHDHDSAKQINDAVCRCFDENQVFRIDHYLGKETVQNLLALRFGNFLFEPLWRRDAIDHVQITVAEKLGVGGRVEFYDRIGALRDMVQNHLLQLLCMVAMEAPASLHHDSIRDEKMKVLRALRPIGADQVRSHTVRAQYTDGVIDGTPVSGYIEELGGTESSSETFVALKLEIDNWRWSGVPFYLRTGKRLKTKHSEIVVQFKEVPHSIFTEQKFGIQPNRLMIRLQPDEGIKLFVMAKEPGPGGFNLRPVSLDISFEETFSTRYPDAYERLLVEVLRGNPALFMRRDEVEYAWRWIDSIRAGWLESEQKVETYVAGSWGPIASSLLLDRDGRAWHPES